MVLLVALWVHGASRNPGRANFQAYEPAVLPSNLYITSRTLELWYGEVNNPELVLKLGKGNSTIAEERSSVTHEANGTCLGAINEICQQLSTPLRQKYFVDTATYNNATDKTIAFTKDGTFIWIQLSGQTAGAVDNNTDWGKVIDSFRAVSLSGVHTERVHAGP